MLAMRDRGLLVSILLSVVLGVVAAGAAFYAAQAQGDPAPLAVPLPRIPQRYEIVPHDRLEESSVVEGRLAEVFLEVLAWQPDGSPPLRYPIDVEIVDFKVWHPYGTGTMSMPMEEVARNDVLIQADLLYDQPLRKLQYSMPHRIEGELLTTYVSRMRYELDRAGARFYADVSPLALEGYRLEHFEYEQETETGERLSHIVYFGPLGPKRVLRLEFVTTPELHELARPYAQKIMGSFKAGEKLRDAALTYDASYIALNELDEQ
jgi:hypothetical protein